MNAIPYHAIAQPLGVLERGEVSGFDHIEAFLSARAKRFVGALANSRKACDAVTPFGVHALTHLFDTGTQIYHSTRVLVFEDHSVTENHLCIGIANVLRSIDESYSSLLDATFHGITKAAVERLRLHIGDSTRHQRKGGQGRGTRAQTV